MINYTLQVADSRLANFFFSIWWKINTNLKFLWFVSTPGSEFRTDPTVTKDVNAQEATTHATSDKIVACRTHALSLPVRSHPNEKKGYFLEISVYYNYYTKVSFIYRLSKRDLTVSISFKPKLLLIRTLSVDLSVFDGIFRKTLILTFITPFD